MALTSVPDAGIPLPAKTVRGAYTQVGPGLDDLSDRLAAASATVQLLARNGLNVDPEEVDLEPVTALVLSYAEEPEETNKSATPARVGRMTPSQILFTDKVLKEWGHNVVESATQLRYLAINKLVHLSESEDEKIQLRAVELIGKMTPVGLFTDRQEITVTHQTADDMRAQLKAKLQKIVAAEEGPQDVPFQEIDVDTELGDADDDA
jgi:hypothetical protein